MPSLLVGNGKPTEEGLNLAKTTTTLLIAASVDSFEDSKVAGSTECVPKTVGELFFHLKASA